MCLRFVFESMDLWPPRLFLLTCFKDGNVFTVWGHEWFQAFMQKHMSLPGWWFHFLFIFIPHFGKWSNLTNIFFRWVETTNQMGVSQNDGSGTQQPWVFPTKNDHFGVFWGYHHLQFSGPDISPTMVRTNRRRLWRLGGSTTKRQGPDRFI